MTLLLSEADVAAVLTAELALAAAHDSFVLLATGDIALLPRERLVADGSTLNVMAAGSSSLRTLASKTYPVVRRDVTKGAAFPVQLFDLRTGELQAVIAGDRLGNTRTGAASAVATRALARPDSRTLGLIGAGWVARGQAEAILAAMPGIDRVLVAGRDPGRLDATVAALAGPSRRVAAASPADVVAEADVLVTATGSVTPVLSGARLRAGTHVNAVGSNYATKRELDDDAVAAADLVVVDDLATARRESGDLLLSSRGFPENAVELGTILTGAALGRIFDDQITLFESQGIAALDLVLAARVLAAARERGLGIDVGGVFAP